MLAAICVSSSLNFMNNATQSFLFIRLRKSILNIKPSNILKKYYNKSFLMLKCSNLVSRQTIYQKESSPQA
jgi:hypothetical protein